MSYIYEFFGYRAEDTSAKSRSCASSFHCPFLHKRCSKQLSIGPSGVCAIKNTNEKVICCPNRLYAEDYKLLRRITREAFGRELNLYAGRVAVEKAREENGAVAVFGHEWGGELPLPNRRGTGNYYVDWILVKLDSLGEIEEFTAVEVQTIDTTGNYQAGRESLLNDRENVNVISGFNWENVNKRIIPQLIYKGQVLQRETKCRTGLFFVCNKPVYDRVIDRLGGVERLPVFPPQPASITFIAYDYSRDDFQDGTIIPLDIVDQHRTTVYKIQEAFSSLSLPDTDVYLAAIRRSLYE